MRLVRRLQKSSVTIVAEAGDEEKQTLIVHRDDFWATTSNKQLNSQPNAPLFQTFRKKKPTGRAMSRSKAYRMIRRRATDAGVYAPSAVIRSGRQG
jgi:hypothetical protein